jgi:mercuric ion transport protein
MKSTKLLSTSLLTALSASLCCITPLLSLLAGTSSLAINFSWIEPYRPFLIAITLSILAFTWYQHLSPKNIECECDDETVSFFQTKLFLSIVTIITFLMLSFPYYSHIFFTSPRKNNSINTTYLKKIDFSIEGMTCEGCESNINGALNKLNGIIDLKTLYEKKNSVIQFDSSKTSTKQIKRAILSTGYQIIKETSFK